MEAEAVVFVRCASASSRKQPRSANLQYIETILLLCEDEVHLIYTSD